MDNFAQNAQNVISMSDYQPESGFSVIAQVEAYWDALRVGQLLPMRSQIDPRGIEQALEYAFVLERIGPGIARLRIAGQHLTNLIGMEVRGMPLTALFAHPARRQIADCLEEVFQTPATARFHLKAAGDADSSALEARMILLPLKNDLGDISRALGCLVSRGHLGVAPRRFEVTAQDINPILPRQSVIGPAPPIATTRPKPVPTPTAFHEGRPRFQGKGGKIRPPYLRLIKSDED